ncbi:MAG: hypothetical protein CME81_05290 [Halomonas sp.]|nr:hypothetical protein [Halomonas sp.]
MKRLIPVLAIFAIVGGCAANPYLVREETRCVGVARVVNMTDDFGGAGISGCAARVSTGRLLARNGAEVSRIHVEEVSGTLQVRDKFRALYFPDGAGE